MKRIATMAMGVGLAVVLVSADARTAVSAHLEQLQCLALNVYWEGRSEPREAQLAIAHVTLNRVAHAQYPDTICEVVYEGAESPPGACQFSWWCDGKSDTPKNPEAWRKSVDIARQAKAARHVDPTEGALFFHTPSVFPNWAVTRQRVGQIGTHIFYR